MRKLSTDVAGMHARMQQQTGQLEGEVLKLRNDLARLQTPLGAVGKSNAMSLKPSARTSPKPSTKPSPRASTKPSPKQSTKTSPKSSDEVDTPSSEIIAAATTCKTDSQIGSDSTHCNDECK